MMFFLFLPEKKKMLDLIFWGKIRKTKRLNLLSAEFAHRVQIFFSFLHFP